MALMLDYSGLRLTSTSLRGLRASGVTGLLRYIAPPYAACDWKRLSRGEAVAILDAGLELILNWEWYEGRCLEGAWAGTQDGRWALAAAKSLGYPRGATIYVSNDTDTSNSWAVIAYLRAFGAALRGYYHVDIYGQFGIVEACRNAHVARYGWQTLAWSYGRVGRCHIYQNGSFWYSRMADENNVRALPLGGWRETQRGGRPAPAPKPKPAPSHAPAPTPVPVSTHLYNVRPGDNLTSIALKYHTTVAALIRLNRLRHPRLAANRDLIQVGEVLDVPGTKAPTKPAPARVYVVHRGDTLAAIATRFHTSVAQLVTWNAARYRSLKRDPGLIQPGWDLRVAA